MTPADFKKLIGTLDSLTDTQTTTLLETLRRRASAKAKEEFSVADQPVSSNNIIIYTDGACSGNPGPGGWGATIIADGERKDICGGEAKTTNNRMELQAAIEALAAIGKGSSVDLWTDSTYVRKGISEWIHGWKKRGWKTAAKKPVKNDDLWKQLDEAQTHHQINWHWVKGHSGHPENERADRLANEGMEKYK